MLWQHPSLISNKTLGFFQGSHQVSRNTSQDQAPLQNSRLKEAICALETKTCFPLAYGPAAFAISTQEAPAEAGPRCKLHIWLFWMLRLHDSALLLKVTHPHSIRKSPMDESYVILMWLRCHLQECLPMTVHLEVCVTERPACGWGVGLLLLSQPLNPVRGCLEHPALTDSSFLSKTSLKDANRHHSEQRPTNTTVVLWGPFVVSTNTCD